MSQSRNGRPPSAAGARRRLLRSAGLLAGLPLVSWLAACRGTQDLTASHAAPLTPAASAAPATAATATATASAAGSAAMVPPAAGEAALAGIRWASGGTAAITPAARAFDPFGAATASVCELNCEATIGPCHDAALERRDISDGWDGLPMLMRLRIVDADCRPVPDALVEVWHTNHSGGYSGVAAPMCTRDAADRQARFFRGYQRSDASGQVAFDSCYPGWYRGRAVHVHLRILKGSYNPDDRAQAWVTTQLLFSDALNSAIFAKQALYRDAGQPDTTLARDGVIGQESHRERWLFNVTEVDGVMVASQTLVLRRSLDKALCRARDFGGPPPNGLRPGDRPGSRGPGMGPGMSPGMGQGMGMGMRPGPPPFGRPPPGAAGFGPPPDFPPPPGAGTGPGPGFGPGPGPG